MPPHRSVLYEMQVQLDTGAYGMDCLLDQSLIGPVQYGWDRYAKDPDSMTFGAGLLAGSPLPGTRRMMVCGYSPQWEGFFVSALGGATYVFHRLGVNYLWLRGRAPVDSVLILWRQGDDFDVRIEPVDADATWKGYTDANGRAWEGFYALQQFVFDGYRRLFQGDSFRILATGPGARYTREGAIGSNQVRKGTLNGIDDWAGRGGLGSRLLQHHRIAAIIFGGDWEAPEMQEGKELDDFFLRRFGKRAIAADIALSQKYRYVPEFETGGTFGVNMRQANDNLLSFNYRSIYASDAERLAQHDHYILDHYLKQFNDEIIKPRNFDHCGEPCAVACKKFRAEYKKDYEPYTALGPQIGVFDQRAAERINKFVDTMGLDSIQNGGTVAWIMELIVDQLIPPQDFGLPAEGPRWRDLPATMPSTPEQFDLVADSAFNADYAMAIVRMILFSEAGAPFRKGIRVAARELDARYGIHSLDRAVFTAHGREGSMVPNQYWVPGMFAPMPIMGKYFTYYENKFMPPRALGRLNVERFVYELYSENSGTCRFHRKWVEDIIDEIITSHFALDLHYWNTNFALARAIHDRESAGGVFWESERVVDLIQGFLEKWERTGLKDAELEAWLVRFRANKWQAAKEFWQEMYDGMAETFATGMPEPHPTTWPGTDGGS
ncbi:MAG: aldehyde ferredoxin oxidoreductase C-terminal domain-containing protein [Anaerolineae bacterium]